jgi:hypothetical protein
VKWHRWGVRMRRVAIVSALALVIFVDSQSIAQSNGGAFDISRSTVAPAGTRVSGGAFALTATIGQPATAQIAAGTYQLTGGFAAGGPSDNIFANGFEP